MLCINFTWHDEQKHLSIIWCIVHLDKVKEGCNMGLSSVVCTHYGENSCFVSVIVPLLCYCVSKHRPCPLRLNGRLCKGGHWIWKIVFLKSVSCVTVSHTCHTLFILFLNGHHSLPHIWRKSHCLFFPLLILSGTHTYELSVPL